MWCQLIGDVLNQARCERTKTVKERAEGERTNFQNEVRALCQATPDLLASWKAHLPRLAAERVMQDASTEERRQASGATGTTSRNPSLPERRIDAPPG